MVNEHRPKFLDFQLDPFTRSWPSFMIFLFCWSQEAMVHLVQTPTQAKNQADIYAKLEDYINAVLFYEMAILGAGINDQKVKVQALTNSAAIRLRASKMDPRELIAVIFNCTLALEIEPKNTKALFRRGLALALTQRWNQAIVDFERALELDPNSPAKKELEVARRQVTRRIGN